MKLCVRCKQEKGIECFGIKNAKTGLRRSYCNECQREYVKEHYKKNSADYKKRSREFNKKEYQKNKERLYEYLTEHPCVKCGESDPVVLEFDHLRDKKYTISNMVHSYSWSSILKEIEKCQVLCANCHKRKTAKDFDWYKNNAD